LLLATLAGLGLAGCLGFTMGLGLLTGAGVLFTMAGCLDFVFF